MTWISIDNVLKAVAPKAGNPESLCFENCIMVIYICTKFQENIIKNYQVTEWTHIYYRNHYCKSLKGRNSKSRLTRVTVLVFCSLSYNAIYLCEVSSKYLELFSSYRADMSS